MKLSPRVVRHTAMISVGIPGPPSRFLRRSSVLLWGRRQKAVDLGPQTRVEFGKHPVACDHYALLS